PGLVRGVDDGARQTQLGQQVRLDRQRALRGRAADVRQRVERLDLLEDDRLELGRRGGLARSPVERLEDRLAEAPLDDRVNRGALLLDEGLHAPVEIVEAPL